MGAQARRHPAASLGGLTDPSFADLGLRAELLDALTALGYEEPTPIQRETIPLLVSGRDLLGQAATGTGKTAAFALPILERMAPLDQRTAPSALVLVPTRELAVQVSEAVHKYGRGLGARVLPIYGGQPIGRQLKALDRGVDVVVATPGRAVDHLGRGTLDLDSLTTVVLDEADEMFDMGFAEDLDAILQATPESRQTVLFSATMPPRIEKLARTHLRDPERVELGRAQAPAGESPLVRQIAFVVPREHKTAALGRVLDVESPTAALVFCRTRAEVDELTETLNGRGYRAESLHGGMDQKQRDKVMSPPAQRRRGAAGRHRRRRARPRRRPAHPRRQLRRAVLAGGLRAPDRPRGPRRPRGRRGHARPAARAPDAQVDRARHRPAADDREGADGRRPARPAPGADAGGAAREPARGRARPLPRRRRDARRRVRRHAGRARGGQARPRGDRRGGGGRRERDPVAVAAVRRTGRPRAASRAGPRAAAGPQGATTRIFVGAGRTSGIRPQDLVGAITGESQLSGRDIGAIEISDRFALVELPRGRRPTPSSSALRGSTIKGKKTTVRRERYETGGGKKRK